MNKSIQIRLTAVAATLAVAACTFAPFAAQASIFGRNSENNPATANAPKGKMIKLTIHNRTASAMTVYVNNQPLTLAADASANIKAPEGSDVLDADHTTVRVHVTSDLSGNTVSFR